MFDSLLSYGESKKQMIFKSFSMFGIDVSKDDVLSVLSSNVNAFLHSDKQFRRMILYRTNSSSTPVSTSKFYDSKIRLIFIRMSSNVSCYKFNKNLNLSVTFVFISIAFPN